MKPKHCFTLDLRAHIAAAIVAAVYFAMPGHSAQAAGTIHTLTGTTTATNGTWSSATWTNGAPTSLSAGDSVTRSTSGNTFTTTLDTDITVGSINNPGSGGAYTWTIGSDGTHVITMDNTGGSGNSSITTTSSNLLVINPKVQ